MEDATADINNANPRPLAGGAPWGELAKEALLWPLYTPFYLSTGQVGYVAAAVAGVGAAWSLFGSPVGLDYVELAEQYLVAGVIQTGVGYAVSSDLQGLM